MLKALKVEQVERIIAAAEILNAKHPSTGQVIRGDAITVSRIKAYNQDERELVSEIASLSNDARAELTALMWLGRGDFDGSFSDGVEDARANSDSGDVNYIAEKSPALPTYLRQGLAAISDGVRKAD